MKVYFATWLTDISLGNSLTKKKANRRLVSYHFVREQGVTNEHMKKYMETGRCDIRKKNQEE